MQIALTTEHHQKICFCKVSSDIQIQGNKIAEKIANEDQRLLDLYYHYSIKKESWKVIGFTNCHYISRGRPLYCTHCGESP